MNNDFVINNGVLEKYKGNSAHVVIPDGVTGIDDLAFQRCENLTSIEIPNSVIYIGEDTFYDREKFTIHGESDSYAEEYAEENDIPFEAIE